jgi:putative transposase
VGCRRCCGQSPRSADRVVSDRSELALRRGRFRDYTCPRPAGHPYVAADLLTHDHVARGPRLDTANAVHHVFTRGIERREIFYTAGDRQDFLERLTRMARDSGLRVFAWSLLPNHVHLLVQTTDIGLSRCMHRLLAGYAVSFNRRHQRCGYLFQNRFKSTLVDRNSYLLELIRYIHLNPVRAGLVSLDALDEYPWTGHAALLGRAEVPPWLDARTVLEHFTLDLPSAADRYREFVRDGMTLAANPPQESGVRRLGEGWSLLPVVRRGREAWAFVERLVGPAAFIDEVRLTLAPPNNVPPHRRPQIDDVLEETAARFGLRPDELVSGGRRTRIRVARNAALRDLVRRCGLSFAQSAKLLGISKWTAARALKD